MWWGEVKGGRAVGVWWGEVRGGRAVKGVGCVVGGGGGVRLVVGGGGWRVDEEGRSIFFYLMWDPHTYPTRRQVAKPVLAWHPHRQTNGQT